MRHNVTTYVHTCALCRPHVLPYVQTCVRTIYVVLNYTSLKKKHNFDKFDDIIIKYHFGRQRETLIVYFIFVFVFLFYFMFDQLYILQNLLIKK